jgi:hypothetical protein
VTPASTGPEPPPALTPPLAEPPNQGFVPPQPAPRDAAAGVPVKPAVAVNAPAAGPRPDRPEVSLEAADAAFLDKRYDEAGRLYAALAQRKALPADRRDHWAYCRAVDVVRRINAKPSTPAEWAVIDAEIAQIRALNPANWFAEYLRSRAAERNPASKPAASLRSNKVIVRGSSPDEEPPPREPQPAPAPSQAPPADPTQGSSVPWSRQTVYTNNFQVVHAEGHRALAEQVARAAEAARAAQAKRWGDPGRGAPWSPRCEVVLFPTAAEFSKATGQPPDSPGFSTMGMNEGRIILRRIHLRADHPNTVRAVLPHEVTHVVLADLFPHQQIPRWADEGMAVLAEPASEQSLRAADLNEPLATGRLFRLNDLTGMDYPDGRYWSVYYAQSVSLTRFLVEQGTPAQFVEFVQEAQRTSYEPALKKVYKIAGYNELQARWLAYAKAKASAEMTASAAEPERTAEPSRR